MLTPNQVLWIKFQVFTGSPIHPPLGALTRAQVKRRRMERRRGASRRLSTTTATNLPLLKRTTNTRRKRKRLTRTFLLITLIFRIIPMLIFFLFHLVNILTLMERTTDFWSHKMHSHLFSLHPSIWEIVENGMQFDNTDNPMFINEQIHKMHKLPLFF